MESDWRQLIESWRSQNLPIQKACEAVKILPGSGAAEGIYFICCRNPVKIADSFSDFVRLYLEQSDHLYPPSGHEHI